MGMSIDGTSARRLLLFSCHGSAARPCAGSGWPKGKPALRAGRFEACVSWSLEPARYFAVERVGRNKRVRLAASRRRSLHSTVPRRGQVPGRPGCSTWRAWDVCAWSGHAASAHHGDPGRGRWSGQGAAAGAGNDGSDPRPRHALQFPLRTSLGRCAKHFSSSERPVISSAKLLINRNFISLK